MRSSRLAVLGALALAAASLGGAPVATASPTETYEISFDGFCDGMAMNIPSSGIGTEYTVDGSFIGCDDAPIFGQAAPDQAGVYGPETGREWLTTPTYGFMYAIRHDHTFSVYGLNGTLISELLVGTWSEGPPAGAESSASAAAAATPQPLAVPSGTREISFDGYCDGMTLTTPSDGTGVRKTVDGFLTGCASGGLFGERGRVDNRQRTKVVQWDNVGIWVQTAIYKDHTWVHYMNSGTTILVLNSGTWSDGPPAIGASTPSTAG